MEDVACPGAARSAATTLIELNLESRVHYVPVDAGLSIVSTFGNGQDDGRACPELPGSDRAEDASSSCRRGPAREPEPWGYGGHADRETIGSARPTGAVTCKDPSTSSKAAPK